MGGFVVIKFETDQIAVWKWFILREEQTPGGMLCHGINILNQHPLSCSGIPSYHPEITVLVICQTSQESDPTA